MNRILVTGAAGCVGANLVRRLVELHHDVNILIQPDTWHPFLDDLDIVVYYGDIRSPKDIEIAIKDCEYIYQVAGIVSYSKFDYEAMYSTHVEGVSNILSAALKSNIKKVVVTASTAGIGIPENRHPINEEESFDLVKYKKVMYMYSKHLTIQLCKEFAGRGLNVSAICPTTIYGQGDFALHVRKMLRKIGEGSLRIAPPGGVSVVSVDDIVDGHILVMEKGKKGENYIFANETITYLDMFNRLARILSSKQITKVSPRWTLKPILFLLTIIESSFLLFKRKTTLTPHGFFYTYKFRYFDARKAREDLGWRPKVNFEQSILKALDFYRQNDLLSNR